MSAQRPNDNTSVATERLFGLGAGLFIAAAILSEGNGSRSALVGLVGAAFLIGATIGSLVIRRRQVFATRTANLSTLKK